MYTIQELIGRLSRFWADQGCVLHHGHDVEVGAGTFNPATFFRALGPEPYRAAYVEPSRRPKDGRYGDNPNRTQLFHQYQVIIKPSPFDIQQRYLRSLEAIGFQLKEHDIRFVHDDWEQPTLGAWGLGWEVWRDGMEVSQFTYFQSVGGIELHPVTVEITYGIERLAMVVQKKDTFYDLAWNETLTYGDLFHRSEVEWSTYNFEAADPSMWRRHFDSYEAEARRLLGEGLALPGYDFIMKASHAFNMLDARGVISVSERTRYIQRIRELSRGAAESYLAVRKSLGYPLLQRAWPKEKQEAEGHAGEESPDLPFEGKEDFVLEIGSEELPASFVPLGLKHLESALSHLFKREGLALESIRMLGTPRRLVAYVKGLAGGKPEELRKRRGPALDAAYGEDGRVKPAGEGFFRSVGIEPPPPKERVVKGEVPSISLQEIRGQPYLVASVKAQGQSARALLAAHLPSLILKADFPKKMRWADLDISYARPLHWIVALHGKQIVPFRVGPIQSGRHSAAHAQLCPGTFSISSASDFVEALRKHKVMVDVGERKQSILDQLAKIEGSLDLEALAVSVLLPQVVHMTEWPMLTAAQFDQEFLEVPRPVLVSEMVQHQKVFPLADAQDRLRNAFVIVADNTPSDAVRAGNMRVISARLADGRFLYNTDLKLSLDELNARLKQIIFRSELGSVYDKAERIARNVEILYSYLPLGDLGAARRAAILCKADLASELVNEFPELQGTVGKIYALQKGEPEAVATAIDEHWMPRGEKTPLPASDAGILVSLADKIDNLLGCFALGIQPHSSSDPYALRRQVLGMVKILVTEEKRLPIMQVFAQCYEALCQQTGLKQQNAVIDAIGLFFSGRIRTVFLDYGLAKDTTEAALALGFTDIYDSFCRAKALQEFRESDARFALLAEVYKRAAGQVEQAKREGTDKARLHEELLREEAERELFAALTSTQKQWDKALAAADYKQAYTLLAELQKPLSHLFDTVKILAEERNLRENRVALLQTVVSLFDELLNFHLVAL